MKQWLAFGLLGIIWGSSFLLIKVAVEDLGALPLVSIRLLLGAGLMGFYLWWAGYPLPASRSDVRKLVVVGVFNVALPFVLITYAEESIDSSLATVLNSAVPLFSLVFAHFAVADEKLTRYKVLGLLVGYLGIIVLTWEGLQSAEASSIRGQAAMLGAVISYGGAVAYMRAQLRHVVPITIAGYSLIVGALIVIPLTLFVGNIPPAAAISERAWAAVLMLGTVNTVVAYFLFYYLIGEWGARASLVTYTFPPIGISLGAIFLGEDIGPSLLLGAALILGGIVVVNYRARPARAVTLSVTPPQPSSQAAD
jgi:drug/metabolite transporter (DMT)-like permease